MARRVGFGDKQRDRAETPERGAPAPQDGTPPTPPSDFGRKLRFGPRRFETVYAGQKRPVIWVVIGFLGIWLVGWTFGIIFTIAALLGDGLKFDGSKLFLLLWLSFAIIGWGVAVWIISRLIRGIRSAGQEPR